MRAAALLTCLHLLFSKSTLANPNPDPTPNHESQRTQPFVVPLPEQPDRSQLEPIHLFRRQSQNACPSGHSSCSSIGFNDACCPSGTNCSRDQGGNVACCPVNAYCTGVISGILSSTASAGTSPTSTSGFVLGGTTTTTATSPTPTTQPPTTASLGAGYSTVPNGYYPFIYIPTTYANAALCTSAYSSCQAASTACFNTLAGIEAVTVSGVGGGTTQAGATGLVPSSASSICSSLSQVGCYGLQSTVCSQFGNGGATSFQAAANVARPVRTPAPGAMYMAAVAAAGMGVQMGMG